MSQPTFVVTSRFKEVIKLINNVEPEALDKVVGTIVTRAVEGNMSDTFSEAEAEQLCNFLVISADDLATIVSGTKYVIDQACFFNLSAEKLLSQLIEHGMVESNATVFAKIWHKSRTSLVEKLREVTFGAPYALNSINWRLQVSMAHEKLSKTKVVNTVLDLHLADPSGALPNESLLLELNKEELLDLYEKLEIIQTQVDKITK